MIPVDDDLRPVVERPRSEDYQFSFHQLCCYYIYRQFGTTKWNSRPEVLNKLLDNWFTRPEKYP